MPDGELIFVGLGLYDERDISVKGLETIKSCDIIFAEFYTSKLSGADIKNMEKSFGKKITLLEREMVEDGEIIFENARNRKVAFLTAGDPMAATTHIDIRLRAEERGIKTRIIHGSSIFTAIPGLLGLQHYKFGRSTTLVYPQGRYFPLSPYEVIKENRDRGLHTMVLLDIDRERNRYMTVNEGIDILLKMERKTCYNLIKDDTLICGVARAGSDNPIVRAGPVRTLKSIDFGPPLHTIVVPGNLHFVEEKALEIFAGLKR